MLNSLQIQNFRLFQDFRMDDLARVNLIVGKNNVGKSSLLEAAFLLVHPNPFAALATLLENRRELSINEPVQDTPYPRQWYDISHLFFNRQLESEAAIKLQAKESPYRLAITYIQDWGQDVGQLPLGLDESDTSQVPSSSYLHFANGHLERNMKIPLEGDLVEGRFLRSRRYLPRSSESMPVANYINTKGLDYDLLADLWNTITLTPKEEDVIAMLQVIDNSVERISFTSHRRPSGTSILIRQKGSTKPVPLGSMGDGLHRLLTIAEAMASSENGFLFIDEIDTGLHYRTITDMWRIVLETAVRLNVQVFATTHSWDCIRSFAEALDQVEDNTIGALFRLQRRGETIEAVRYEAERIAFAIEQEIEIR
jgi:predicted ATPase